MPGDTDLDDVLIVGYGPVGQLLSILLAQRGLRVTAVDRWPRPYAMPRAVAFDGEAARILAVAGLGEIVDQVGRVLDADGDPDQRFGNPHGGAALRPHFVKNGMRHRDHQGAGCAAGPPARLSSLTAGWRKRFGRPDSAAHSGARHSLANSGEPESE